MSTRSAIGFLEYDGSVTGIYCHFDGYPSHNGRILTDHYDTIDAVHELLDLGNLSILGEVIGEKQNFERGQTDNWCLAYGRDRGERNQEAIEFEDVEEFLEYFRGSGCEYFYVFDGKQWSMADYKGHLVPLTEEQMAD